MNKFNVHDTVWVMFGNKPKSLVVAKVVMSSDCYPDGEIDVSYLLFDPNVGLYDYYNECDIFATKEELINSL